MSGYVRIHRALIGHPAFRNDAEAMAFAWMVAKAAWKPCRVRYKERGLHLQRGQLAVSQRDMAHALDRDKAWIERLWKRLKGEAMIKVDAEAGVAVITICNYANFQGSEQRREAADEAPREADARQGQGTEQGSEEEKELSSEAKASSPRIWVCPPGVDPQHWADFRKARKTKRATDSETAYRAQLKLLDEISDDEWPPGRLVQLAAEKGYATIIDPRKSKYDRPAPSNNGLGKTSAAIAGLGDWNDDRPM